LGGYRKELPNYQGVQKAQADTEEDMKGLPLVFVEEY
jgi:hypothetical protein